jgi:thioredoxin reductase (NADPH)
MYDLIVIGGGPAALAATFYAIGKQMNVVMVYEELGGKIGWLESLVGQGHAPYLPGNELVHLLTLRTTAQPGHTIDDRVLCVTTDGPIFNVHTQQHGVLHSHTVLVATGAAPLQLNVPGTEQIAEGGLGYSATTYAHLTTGQRVAVIGGANRALSGAAELVATAEQVYLVGASMRALITPLGQALCQHPRVEVLEEWEVRCIASHQKLITLTITRDGATRELDVDRVFVALGLVPNSNLVRDLGVTDINGFILVNAFHETALPGLFAAGDSSSLFSENVLSAIGDGARAAITAYDYLLARRLVAEAGSTEARYR